MCSETFWDKAVLCLSTDWLRPFWPVLGIFLQGQEADQVQRAARAEVKKLLDGKTVYWHVSFEPSRIESTEKGFFNSVRTEGLSEDSAARLRFALDSLASKSDESEKTSWIFDSLLDMAAKGECDLSGLPSTIRRVVRDRGDAAGEEAFDSWLFNQQASASQSEWDQFIKGITPDLPEFTADAAASMLRNISGFRAKWSRIAPGLSPSERRQLAQWLAAQAKELAGSEFEPELPDWMI